MAFEKIGLGGVLTFNSRNAVAGMYRTGRAFDQLNRRAGGMGRAAGMAAVGIGGLGMVTAPLVMAVGGAVKEYAKFDQAMANVASVSNTTGAELDAQRQKAMSLGSDTKFTAEQAAQGMEALGRAGFSSGQQIDSMSAITMMATAENMNLNKAAEITANTINMFGLQASQAGMVTDTLAYISANSSTNITQLGNSMRYAGPKAAELGMSVEELSSVMGVLGDSGLRGSMAGTSFSNMLRAVAKPTEKAKSFLDKYNISLRDAQGNFVGTTKLVRNLDAAFSKISNPKKRDFMKQTVLGERGARAFNILARADSSKDPQKNSVATLLGEVNSGAADGSAAKRAETMMNTMIGQTTLLKSALTNINILIMDSFGGLGGSSLKPFVTLLQNIGKAWVDIDNDIPDKFMENKFGKNTVSFVRGIKKGIEDIKVGMEFVSDQITHFAYVLKEKLGGDGMGALGRFLTVFTAITVASTPVVAALLGIAFVVTTVVIPTVSALATAVNAAFWPVLVAVAAVGLAFLVLRNENESFFDWSIRMWNGIKVVALDLWQNVLEPMWQGVAVAAMVMWPSLEEAGVGAITAIRDVFNEFAALFGEENGHQREGWMALGAIIMAVVMTVSNLLLRTLGGAISIVSNTFKDLRGIIQSLYNGEIFKGLGKLAQFIGNTLLIPVRLAAVAIAALLQSIMDIPGVATALNGVGKFEMFQGAITKLNDFGKKGIQIPGLETKSAKDAVDGFGGGSKKKKKQDDGGLSLTEKIKRAGELRLAQQAQNREDDLKRREEELQNSREANERGKRQEKKDKDKCTSLFLDGKKVAKNQAKHQQDLSDRMGFQTPPFIRRTSAAQGRIGN